VRAIASLGSVAAASLVLSGCAVHPVRIELEPSALGRIVARPGRAGAVVAAPHGTSDPGTAEIATELADRSGFGLVVATGFVTAPGEDGRPALRYHVNRPLEGAPGRDPAEERATPGAARVYETYERRVREAAGGLLAFYVEIHGDGRSDTMDRIEIATVGIDADAAVQLRTLLELTRDAHLRGHPEAPRLAIAIEPADPVFHAAGGAKRQGILRLPERALHIELPRAARREFREVYTAVLADFLAQAATLRPIR
jgi:hypothetical protein